MACKKNRNSRDRKRAVASVKRPTGEKEAERYGGEDRLQWEDE